MGFLSRLRGGGDYGPTAAAKSTPVLSATLDTLGSRPSVENNRPAASDAILAAARVRGADALFLFGHRSQGQRTTAAERAFMDLRRGSND